MPCLCSPGDACPALVTEAASLSATIPSLTNAQLAKRLGTMVADHTWFFPPIENLPLLIESFAEAAEEVRSGVTSNTRFLARVIELYTEKKVAEIIVDSVGKSLTKAVLGTVVREAGRLAATRVARQTLSSKIAAGVANGARTEAQKKIYGAAAKQNASKIMGEGVVGARVGVGLQTGIGLIKDTYKYAQGDIGGEELAENLVVNILDGTGSVICGAVGQVLIPVPFLGAFVGSTAYTLFRAFN